MALTDGNITLTTPTEQDADRVAAAVRRSYAELAPFMPWAMPDHGTDDALLWIRRDIDPEAVQFMIVDERDEMIGTCGINRFDHSDERANLGYWVRSDRTGRGVATRATRLLARHGLTDLGLARVEIVMSVENEPSRRVAERAGATFEGTLRNRLLLHARHHDAHCYSFVTDDLAGPLADGS